MSSALSPRELLGPATTRAGAAPRRHTLSPMALRAMLFGGVLIAGALGYISTNGEAASRAAIGAGEELTRLLRMMTLLKVALGAGALALVSVRFRFPISRPLAFSYVAAGTVMAAGPGVMWNMAHIGLGALLLHGGLASLFALAWIDGGTTWRLSRRA